MAYAAVTRALRDATGTGWFSPWVTGRLHGFLHGNRPLPACDGDSNHSLQYASDRNRKSVAQWLGSEALTTIAHACEFYREMVSVALNIVLTLAVFYLAPGWEIASAIAASLVASFTLVMMLRHTIEISAGAMQQRRQEALLSIEPAWT